ncbi:MAG: aminomethyl-transferring glycine dehydrogenase subunit GcvPA [Thermoplasmata archaeon]|nr:MAG: aminomethyl-transferring glycine dehydrogenase subunit GcvPA [Thermoplasmata archaeon]
MEEMLKYLGIKSVDELFEDLPPEIKTDGLNLHEPKEEMEVEMEIKKILSKNKSFFDMPFFLPIIKPHYIPPAVDEIVSRQEFYTSYTPYQAEASQGILQAMFEYQSIIAELTGMDAANVSMYDSATALGEAALMAYRIKKKRKILIPRNIFWHKKKVLENYAKGAGLQIIEVDYGEDGRMKLNHEEKDVAAIYIENPNFFGIIDDRYKEIAEMRERLDALLIAGIDPLSLAIYNPPSCYNADIVIGEGYFGNPLNFGGPLLGIFACKKEYIRQMPGKIVGATVDKEDKRAFCMTLQTREQHIRRGKATSNICSNQALCCIAFLAYVALLGRNGLRRVAKKNMDNAKYMANKLQKIGFSLPFHKKFFNEFVVIGNINGKELNSRLSNKGVYGGLPIDEYVENGILFGVTEMHSREIINFAVEKIKEAMEEKL